MYISTDIYIHLKNLLLTVESLFELKADVSFNTIKLVNYLAPWFVYNFNKFIHTIFINK